MLVETALPSTIYSHCLLVVCKVVYVMWPLASPGWYSSRAASCYFMCLPTNIVVAFNHIHNAGTMKLSGAHLWGCGYNVLKSPSRLPPPSIHKLCHADWEAEFEWPSPRFGGCKKSHWQGGNRWFSPFHRSIRWQNEQVYHAHTTPPSGKVASYGNLLQKMH